MSVWKGVRRRGLGIALACAVVAVQGCAYVQHRVKDTLDMVDVGITVTETPYLSLYGCGLDVMTFGAGHVDGYLVGIGGGQAGYIRHYEKTIGLVLWATRNSAGATPSTPTVRTRSSPSTSPCSAGSRSFRVGPPMGRREYTPST